MVGPSTQNSGPKTVTMDPMLAGKSLAESSFRATFVAAVRQPVTSARQGLAVLWHRPREIVAGNLPVDLEAKDALTETPGTPGFEKSQDVMGFPKPQNGTLKWLVDGRGFSPSWIARSPPPRARSIRRSISSTMTTSRFVMRTSSGNVRPT